MKPKYIELYDNNKTLLQKIKITSLSINEHVLLKKSIEVYNDPEPCIIHRSAVQKLFYTYLLDYMEQHINKGELIKISDIDDDILNVFEFGDGVCFVK